jgi:hypothetical protein
MIIYGWRESKIKTQQMKNETCPDCKETGSMIGVLFTKYFHIFWIPLFPYSKKGVFHCPNCSNRFDQKSLMHHLPRAYQNFKSDTKIPIWQFSGLILVLGIVLWTIWSSQADKNKEKEYVQNPIVGDVYVYEVAPGAFSTFKVTDLMEDSLVFVQNNYQIDVLSGIRDIDQDSSYSHVEYIISNHEIGEMYEENEIRDIIRK